jgi:DNA-binding XRE family transcriptional regulator/uncharacterized protein YuzE
MRISYDDKSGGLLISFGDPVDYSVSTEVAPGVVVDFDKHGKALAVELEDAGAVVDPNEIRKLIHPRIKDGSDLRIFRERLGLTQEQLGDLIDVPRNTVARWEREELPIAKVRQLELALSAILRPRVERAFEIVFSDDEGEGSLECGFCGERYELPFGMALRKGKPSHEPGRLIEQHYEVDIEDDSEKIPRCSNWHRWRSAPWELRNSDDGEVIARGTVHVSKRGGIRIETAFRASQADLKRRSS